MPITQDLQPFSKGTIMTNSHKCLFPISTTTKLIDTLPKAPRTFSEDPNVNFENLKKLIYSYTHIHISQQATYNGKKKRGGKPSTSVFNPAGLNYDTDPKDWSVDDEPEIKRFMNTLITVSSRSEGDLRDALMSITNHNNAFSMELIKMDEKVKKLDQNKSSWDADEINLRSHVNTLKSFIKLTSDMKNTMKVKLDEMTKDQQNAPVEEEIKNEIPYFLTAQR